MKVESMDFNDNGLPIRLLARMASQACAADDADEETKKYNEEELHISPLHVAAFNGTLKTVEILLKQGIDPNSIDSLEWTPLHDAVIQGHIEVAKKLISAGANVNAQDIDELYTPLHDAARMNNQQMVELLLGAGANPLLTDRWENMPYDVAEQYSFEKIMDLLKT